MFSADSSSLPSLCHPRGKSEIARDELVQFFHLIKWRAGGVGGFGVAKRYGIIDMIDMIDMIDVSLIMKAFLSNVM